MRADKMIDSLLGAVKPGICQHIFRDFDGMHGELLTDRGFFSMIISAGSNMKAYDCEKKEQNEVAAMKDAFRDYIYSIDDEVFAQACEKMPEPKLSKIKEAVVNGTDKKKVQSAINEFTAACNEVIMEKVVQLKSQMA